ncbi:MAG: DUF5689 domain-containing protein [Bacteroidales bacterium]
MNKFSKIFAILFIFSGMLCLNSCVKEKFDPPAFVTPHVNFSSNTTLAALQQYYADSIPFVDGFQFGIIDDDLIVEGIIVATDESGNFYKQLIIEDATAGLQIQIDQTNLYNSYRLGQRIFVKCKGLYLGDYGGNMQLGYNNNGVIGRIPYIYIKDHVFPEGLPGTVPAPIVVAIQAVPLLDANLNMLVKIDSVHFSDAGQTFSTATSSTNHNIVDANLVTLALRTSNYASFAGNRIPYGTGSVTGVLSIFNGDYQFFIRDLNDLQGFDNIPPLCDEGFATAGSLGTFTQYSVTGAQIWAQSSFGSDYFAKMSGYSNGYYANEDWLISPSMNFDNYTGETLKFFTMMNYGTASDGSLKLYYSSDYSSGAPSTATWTEVTGLTLSGGSWDHVSSGNIDLSSITGSNVHIAFKYTCTTSNVATWEVGGITVN